MEHRTKRNHILNNLVNDFESMLESDAIHYIEDKTFFQLINYYEKQFLIDKALEVVDYAIDQFPYRSDFFIIKSRLLLSLSKFKLAIKVLDHAEMISPFESEISIYRARALNGLGKHNRAQKILNKMKLKGSQSELPDILLSESYIYESQKDYHGMFNVLSEALNMEPMHAECLERMWLSVELSRRYKESIEFHKQLVDKKPYNAYAWYNLGHSFESEGEYEKAIEALEYAFIIDKDMEVAYLDCADLCSQIKNYKKALSIYEEANQYFGPESELLVLIAECQIHLSNFLSAKASLFTALSLDPYNDEIYFYLGECYSKEENWHSAINSYKKAISIENNREEYHGGIALMYIQLGNYDLAQKHLKRASKILPEESKFWFQRACILIRNNKMQEAISLLDEADDYAIDATLLYCRAACFAKLGMKSEALEILDEALNENFIEHNALFEIDPQLKFDKEILSIINYYEGENI